MATKTAMITIAGRPNVGKSTLTNFLVGEKIAIVSNKPQTTRNRICGIVTRDDTQFVFVDTPGFHKPRTKLGDYMVGVTRDSIADVDATIVVVEPIASVGVQEEALLKQLSEKKCPVVLAINKIDTVEKESLLEVISVYSQAFSFAAIIPISAKTGDGVDALLEHCESYAQEGPFLFPEDFTTDQPERQVMAEIIREKLLWCLDREVPHGTAVEITNFSIYCEKASHKGIIIGKHGDMLKKISSMARADCEKFMGTRVYLTTWVKVKENWRDSDFLVRNFGYSE